MAGSAFGFLFLLLFVALPLVWLGVAVWFIIKGKGRRAIGIVMIVAELAAIALAANYLFDALGRMG